MDLTYGNGLTGDAIDVALFRWSEIVEQIKAFIQQIAQPNNLAKSLGTDATNRLVPIVFLKEPKVTRDSVITVFLRDTMNKAPV